MANGAIFNTAIGQQFGGNNRKSSTLINTNNGNTMDTEVTPEATPKQKAEATPQYRLNKEKVLDDSLRNRGLTVTATSKADQDKYWKGLSKEMQDQMTKFYNDGYSFDGARTLLEQVYGKSPQSLRVQRAGEAKGSDTWIGAIQDSLPMKVLDWINLPGKVTEGAMNLEQRASQGIQDWSNEKMGVNNNSTLFRDRANKNLKEKIDALPADKVKELTDKFNEDSALGKTRRSLYGSVENYIEEKSKNWWEDLLNIGTYESPAKTLPGDSKFENFVNKYGFQGDNGIAWDRIVANAPRSGVDLATSVLYAVTNPFDNLSDLAYLFTTKEGLDIVAEEYGSLEKLQETMQSDPFGFLSDIFDAKDLISRAKARQKKVQGALNQSKINTKKNEILKMASDIAKEYEKDEGKTTVDTLDNIGKLDKLTEEQKQLEEKQNKIDESQKKWEERAEQASTLSDFFIDTEPMNKAIINYLSEKGGIGKSIAYWYSLTQSPLSTIWKGVATEKQVEQNKQQTLDELDEGKEPEKETITVTNQVAPGIANSKAVQNVGEVWKRIRDKWEERTTGLTPDMKARIQQNPYVKAYWDQVKATIEDEGLSNQEQIIEEQFLEEIGNELLARIEKEENRVEETGVMYNKIRNLPQTFDFTPTSQGIMSIFDRAGITIRPDGSLFFRSWSEAMTTDRAHAQILWNLMLKFMNGQALTSSEFLDLRSQLKAIENYKKGMDPTSAGKSAMLARQLRNEINKVAHKEIPGLEEIDAQYHKQISYLQQLKKDITYAQGPNSGKVRSNFYSIIRNINSANRKQYAGIISGIFPEIKDRVEAVRLMPKLIKAYQKNSGLLQSVVNMPKLLSAAQLASGDGFLKSAMTLLIGQFVEEGLIRPVDKKLRQATIDEVINQLDPIAKLKLEEAIKNAQDGQKLTEEEKMVLQEVTKKIAESIEEYRENLPKLPAPEADVINEDGTITLARGEPNTPEPQRKSTVEIQLHKPEAKVEEVQRIQEENNVDKQTAERIEDSVQAFIQQMGGEDGKVTTEEIDYNNFSTPTLNELRASDRIPVTEKEKIEEVLKQRLDVVEEGEWEKMDKYFAVKIDNLNAEEQRIGKVGKNKVNKSVAQQQEANWTKRREAIIKEIEQFYYDGDPDSAIKAEEKFRQLEQTPRETIESYKKSQNYIYESAEREVLNRFLKEWDKQPKFTKSMTQKQLDNRAEILGSIKTQNGYEMETTPYNDRYVLKNGNEIVDRGAIVYNKDGTVEVRVQDINGFIESGLLETLPSDVIVKVSNTEDSATVGELRGERFQFEQNNLNKEKNISREEGINQRNIVNGKSVGELAKGYGVRIEGADEIKVSELRKAYGKYKDGLITLAKTIKESTASHELLHAVFDMLGEKRKNEILKMIMDSEGVDRITAEEILADNFSQYFRTGEFDNYIAPKTFIDKIKAFFKKVKQFITGVYDNQTVMKKLFDDIIEGKIENTGFTDRIRYDEAIKVAEGFPGSPLRNQVSRIRVRGKDPSSPDATFSSNTTKLKILGNTYTNKKTGAQFTKGYTFPISDRNQNFVNFFNKSMREGDSHAVIGEYDGYTLLFPLTRNLGNHFEKHGPFDPENLIATVNDFDTLKVDPNTGRYVFEKQLPNGNWLRAVFSTNYREITFFESPTPRAGGPIIDRDGGSRYQMQEDEKPVRTEEEKAELGGKAVKFIQNLDVNFGNGYGLDQIDFIVNALKSYKPDMREWYKAFKENFKPLGNRGYTFDPKQVIENQAEYITDDLIDLYRSIENIANRENFVEGLGYYLEGLKKNGNRSVIGNAVKKFIDKHEPLNIKYENSEYEEPLRTWLIDHPLVTIQGLIDTYSPDPIEWKDNTSGFRAPSVKDLAELKKILKNISDNITPEETGFFKHPIRGEQASRLVYKYQIDREPKLIKERMTKQVEDLWKGILDPMGNNIANSIKGVKSPEAMNMLHGEIFEILGETYVDNISQWHKLANDRIREFIDSDGIGEPKTWNMIPEEKLHQINAKLREIFSIPMEWEDLENFEFDTRNSTRDAWLRSLILNAFSNYQGANPEAPEMIEKTKQLVALSNMSKDNLEKQIKGFEGKSPMPSIAVTDVNVPHVTFGDITLVFDKNTVDPEADSRNVLYASDAATPMFPSDIYTEGGRISYEELDPLYKKMIKGVKDDRATKEVNPDTIKNILSADPKHLGYTDEDMQNTGISEMAYAMVNMLYDETYNETGKDITEEEAKYWYDQFYKTLSEHAPRKMLPAKYFTETNAEEMDLFDNKKIDGIIMEIQELYPTKELYEYAIANGPDPDEYSMEDYELDMDTAGEIEYLVQDKVNDVRDNVSSPQEAGNELLVALVDDYSYDKEKIKPLIEKIFGPLDQNQFEWDTAKVTDIAKELTSWMDETGTMKLISEVQSGTVPIEELEVDEDEFLNNHSEWERGTTNFLYKTIYDYVESYIGEGGKLTRTAQEYKDVYKNIFNELKDYIPEEHLDEYLKQAIGEEPTGGPKPRPATPENIVIAMKQNRPIREVVEGGLRDIVGMEGKRFSSLEEVRKKNLFDTTHGGWTEDIKDLEKRYDTLTHEIFKEYFMNEELDVGISDVRIDIRDAYNKDPRTESQFREYLEEIDSRWKKVPDEYLRQIMDVIAMGKEVPVRFSESKPERVVNLFKEVKYILAPLNQVKDVNNIVRGTPLEGKVRGYQVLGKKSERLNAIKKLQKQYGDIFFSMAGTIFPIASLLRMAEKLGGGDDDDQQEA